ncbi:hypothetical protein [Pontimicrobium aquaticum]|uniref:Uncharacterized protein n=1 Tax=Pontimicrobium aquaticum TaxID=2565367 RepID=A0A4U0EQX6_9FLAO|nr:hypothetical protein [Pontimicrobium aquaticum]TJY34116.1 hypothetical protein E5167_12440 [Pontimicrobium aquaticum]
MVLNNIEKLIEKYDNGETTLQEEQQLKDYFSQETVPPHLEVYKSMFQYFLYTHEEQFTKDVPLKSKKTYSLYQWISVAAVAVIMLGIFTQFEIFQTQPQTLADLTPQERAEYEEAKEVLALFSSNFNNGTDKLMALNMVSDNFDKGTDNMAYLSEVSSTTNKILKTN